MSRESSRATPSCVNVVPFIVNVDGTGVVVAAAEAGSQSRRPESVATGACSDSEPSQTSSGSTSEISRRSLSHEIRPLSAAESAVLRRVSSVTSVAETFSTGAGFGTSESSVRTASSSVRFVGDARALVDEASDEDGREDDRGLRRR